MCPSEATYLPSDLFQPASTVKIQLNVRGVEAGGKGTKLYLSQRCRSRGQGDKTISKSEV